MKINISRKTIERMVYIGIIMALVVYGFKDSEAAATLIHAVKEAFSILL
jgi:uncharacterized membrane protein YqhA